MQKFSYHTHSTFSDGKNTLREMIERAVSLGWEEIGISDHLIIHKNIKNSVSWRLWQREDKIFYSDFSDFYDKFSCHIDEIHEISNQYPIKVKIGAEVDFFTYPGWLDEFIKLREKLKMDYCISGNHFLFTDKNGNNIIDVKDAEMMPHKEQEAMLRRHFRDIIKAIESKQFNFIAHIDYIRKISSYNDFDFREEKEEVIKALSANNVATEISTKGLRKDNNFYPDEKLLEKAIKNNVKFVISDDAHRLNELGYCFDQAENILQKYNCHNRFKL